MRHISRLLGRSTRRATFATLASPAAKPSNGKAKFVYAATGTLIGAVAGYSALSYQLRDDGPPGATQSRSSRDYATEGVTMRVRLHPPLSHQRQYSQAVGPGRDPP